MVVNNLEKIVEELSSLSIMEAAELSKMLEKKWGLSTNAIELENTKPKEIEVSKKNVSVVLVESGTNKIGVIKEVRNIMNLGLIEAKKFVENVPKTIKEDINSDDAQKLKSLLEKAGAKVEIR